MQAITYHPYYSDIEAEFIKCRGKSLWLSPKDWQLIETWEQMQIPLHIVTGAIKGVFETKHDVTSLAYCKQAVERSFETWQGSQVGKSQYVEVEPSCATCDGGKEITRKKANARFDWDLEFIPCPDCEGK